jgi:RHS repeat-associated protein
LNPFQSALASTTASDAFITKISSGVYTVSLTTSSNNVDTAHPATVTSTVTKQGSGTAPTGNVEFHEGQTTFAQSALSNGTASGNTSALGVGVHALAAIYNSLGDGASSGVVYQAINQASTCGAAAPQTVPANAPLVVLVAPTSCATLAVGSPITIQGDAVDPNGTVTSVAFYVNGTQIGTTSSKPYTTSWTPTAGGLFTLTAVATDNSSTATTSAPLQVTVSSPPVVHIDSPVTGTSLSLGSTVAVSAHDPTGAGNITSVAFFDNGTLIGTTNVAPFTVNWTPQSVGNHILTAQPTNGSGVGNSDNSPSVTVIANSPPSVSIAAPLDGATLDTPANTTITATATDNSHVAQVQFFVNGASIGTATSSTTSFSVPWTNVGPGVYTLTAVATDDGGATTTSAAITVKVGVHTDAGETIVFLHNDFAGNPIAATDTTGAIVWKESYRPFGDRLVNASTSSLNRQWFAGKAADAETGLSYFGARYYDPVAGRFMETDAAQFRDTELHSFNRYAYANNNPFLFVDPDGNQPEGTIGPVPPNWFRDTIIGRIVSETVGTPIALFNKNDVNPLSGNIENFAGDKKAEAVIGILSLGIGGSRAEGAVLKEVKVFSKEKQALVEMAKADKRRGITQADMDTYKELNKGLPDPFPDGAVRGWEAHESGNEISQSPHGHVGPVKHIPITDVKP